ncbi:hypothetical protein [Mycoplana dimorpha]|uniref:Capsular polysaccharide transport system permease protein n=1 Tax=Mycoplana dimorpha TaxID=28320 RepID=A0A2T5B1H6_MYCDI|nr:hypothetical protein [Mycoplana dimorpha]PTM92829.1 capsular polysaccharide transport system permease protein [Mycoplana dimorpha]
MKTEPDPPSRQAASGEQSKGSNLLDMPKARMLRRAERQKQRLMREASETARAKTKPDPFDEDDELSPAQRRADEEFSVRSIFEMPKLAPKKRKIAWTAISFFLAVIVPTVLTGLYFAFVASPQYEVEAQFAVRGANQSSLSALGLGSLMGTTVEAGDSYIVANYIHSQQILQDMKEQAELDVRKFYARDDVDFVYKTDAHTPLDQFVSYWRDMVNVSFNSTTGNVTLQVYAFTPEDAKAITDAVLLVSENLVNRLSDESRNQYLDVVNKQVERAENRLASVREQLSQLRQTEQAVDPATLAKMESTIIESIEQELASVRTRYKALVNTVSRDAPSARVLERQIVALEAQLVEQKARVGSGVTEKPGSADATHTVSDVIDKFSQLMIEQEFAVKAYSTSLAGLETAMVEAQKQERFFATYVAPRIPEIAIYPKRILNTMLGFLAFFAAWLVGFFVYKSIKDHAI